MIEEVAPGVHYGPRVLDDVVLVTSPQVAPILVVVDEVDRTVILHPPLGERGATDAGAQLRDLGRAVGDATRLRLLHELRTGTRTLAQLCAALDSPRTTLLHHLALLRSAGLIEIDVVDSEPNVYALRLEGFDTLAQAARASRCAPDTCRKISTPAVRGSSLRHAATPRPGPDHGGRRALGVRRRRRPTHDDPRHEARTRGAQPVRRDGSVGRGRRGSCRTGRRRPGRRVGGEQRCRDGQSHPSRRHRARSRGRRPGRAATGRRGVRRDLGDVLPRQRAWYVSTPRPARSPTRSRPERAPKESRRPSATSGSSRRMPAGCCASTPRRARRPRASRSASAPGWWRPARMRSTSRTSATARCCASTHAPT